MTFLSVLEFGTVSFVHRYIERTKKKMFRKRYRHRTMVSGDLMQHNEISLQVALDTEHESMQHPDLEEF